MINAQEEFDRDPASYNEASETPDIYSQIDAANGWEERGAPQLGFDEAADEMGAFFLWMLTGAKRNARKDYKNLQARDIERSLKEPAIIGRRMIAVIYNLHPDFIEAKTLTALAELCGTTFQNLSKHKNGFFENFPVFKNRISHNSQAKKNAAILKFRKTGL